MCIYNGVYRCDSGVVCRDGGPVPQLLLLPTRYVHLIVYIFLTNCAHLCIRVVVGCINIYAYVMLLLRRVGDYHWSFTALWYAFIAFSICAVTAIAIKVALRSNKVLIVLLLLVVVVVVVGGVNNECLRLDLCRSPRGVVRTLR